jgi:hypothetical protein
MPAKKRLAAARGFESQTTGFRHFIAALIAGLYIE